MVKQSEWDVIIVGGGSSGCVFANRLSATGKSVLLIEAGDDTPPDSVPEDIRDSNPTKAYFNPRYQWGSLKATFATGAPERSRTRYEQAKVLGGGSSINAQVANRGGPDDYDGWAACGAKGWAWEDVLPYFRKLESDKDFAGHFHGSSGPIPINRVKRSDWSGFVQAVAKAFEQNGLMPRDDFNGDYGDGFSPVPLSNDGTHRVSAATAYLSVEVRARSNLKILTNTFVSQILFSGTQVTGVATVCASVQKTYHTRNLIMCAGALHTPAILMRSGIGPGDHLLDLGIPVIADLPGVGSNLQEHPSISVSAYLHRHNRMRPDVSGHIQAHARYSSRIADCALSDMAISVVAKSAWHPLGKRLGTMQLWVNRSYSTGHVRLISSNPSVEPKVDFNWLHDRRDLDRLKAGVAYLAEILRRPALATVAIDPFPSAWNARAKSVSTISPRNHFLTTLLARMMDGPVWLRRFVVKRVITNGVGLDDLLASDRRLEEYVMTNVTGNWHPTSTCRMGAADDPMAVADPEGRLRAVTGVWIGDASVMPFCPKANTNIPTIMLAEKLADTMLGTSEDV
ncbi:MAG: GMC family oxidoreductase N-terminal domain-containing protein [Paraburkholderia sp.]|uniref:GMC family oxidoreductase n=1 Tax=Paraburkholderia sp. TaxID=1926495 RepID=UPI0039780899